MTTQTKHTPGPWRATQDTRNDLDRYLLHGNGVGNFGHFQGWASDGVTTEAEDAANAMLIAAAPDLLEACEFLTRARESNLTGEKEWDVLFNIARKAIKKARGEG